MRNLRLLALLAPALLVLPIACEDSSSSSSGSFSPEAGAGFETGPQVQPEAGPLPEAGPDVTVPPAPQGVSVTVTDGKAPLKDVRVFFHDATGAVSSQAKTDATGKATIAIAPSMVTVISGDAAGGGEVSNVTFTSVVDGDKLVVVAPPPSLVVDPVPVGTLSVAFTTVNDPIVTSSNSFFLTPGSCAASGIASIDEPVQLSLYEPCVMPQMAVLAAASNTDNTLQGFAFAKNVAKPAANGVTNVGPLTFAAPGSTTQTATAFPAATDYHYAQLFAIANGTAFGLGNTTGAIDQAGGLTYKTPTNFAEAYQSRVSANSNAAGASRATELIRREAVPAGATPLTFDFSKALPLVNDVGLANPTPARPDITITPAASLAGSDGGYVSIRWYAAATGTSGLWTFVVAPTATAFKVPALPADAADFAPIDTTYASDASFVEASQLPGYKELKALPVSTRAGLAILDSSTPLPAAGTVKLTRWNPLLD